MIGLESNQKFPFLDHRFAVQFYGHSIHQGVKVDIAPNLAAHGVIIPQAEMGRSDEAFVDVCANGQLICHSADPQFRHIEGILVSLLQDGAQTLGIAPPRISRPLCPS